MRPLTASSLTNGRMYGPERKRGEGTFRLNYTNSSFENIDKGISILGKVIEDMKKSL